MWRQSREHRMLCSSVLANRKLTEIISVCCWTHSWEASGSLALVVEELCDRSKVSVAYVPQVRLNWPIMSLWTLAESVLLLHLRSPVAWQNCVTDPLQIDECLVFYHWHIWVFPWQGFIPCSFRRNRTFRISNVPFFVHLCLIFGPGKSILFQLFSVHVKLLGVFRFFSDAPDGRNRMGCT